MNLDSELEKTFNQALKHWEQKNYKKSLKLTNEILSKSPNHGQSMCVKGLVLHSLGQKKEGYEVAKAGLPFAITASIGWRVFGIMAQNDKRYKEAAGSFKNAIRRDPKNQNILRDLAHCQAQIRDYEGLLETRKKMIEINSTALNLWPPFAIAQHLNDNYVGAVKVLDAYLDDFQDDPNHPHVSRTQKSEVMMYKIRILKESGNFAACYEAIEEHENFVVDRMLLLEWKGEVGLKLGKLDDSAKVYEELISLNSENFDYLSKYQQSVGLDSSIDPANFSGNFSNVEREKLLEHYDSLEIKYPQSLSIPRIALNIASGDKFRQRLVKYVRKYLVKTIPSLFLALKSLYVDEAKVKIVEEVMLSNEKSLKESAKLPGESETQSPATLLWVLQYLAYHYDQIGNHSKGLNYINEALKHTPTMVELYLCKAKILKHQGDPKGAFEALDEARNLDLADRFLNTKASKYALRANLLKEGFEIAKIFAVQNADKKFNLNFMQCMWYEIERGEALYRLGNYSEALRDFFLIQRHFQEIYDDQYDFHSYCLRKFTFNSYIDALRYYDKFWDHQWFRRSCQGIIQTYIKVHDDELHKTPMPDTTEIKKQRKEETMDEDDFPDGEELLRKEKPLEEAMEILKKLEKYSPNSPETWELMIDLQIRRKKYLQVLKAILKLKESFPTNSHIKYGITQLYAHSKDVQGLPKEILDEHQKALQELK